MPVAKPDSPAERTHVSVVVPVFNSAASLDELWERIRATMESAAAVASWDLILVNDGSEDASWDRVVALSGEYSEVRGLDLTRNWGQHNALLAGIHSAAGEVIATLDDDLQNPPEEIPRLLAALGDDIDLVYGKPIVKRHNLLRRIATRIVRWIVHALTVGRIPVGISGFRAFRASLLDGVGRGQGTSFAMDISLTEASTGIATVSVRHDPRRYGRSGYSLGMLAKRALIQIKGVRRRVVHPGRRSPTYAVRSTTGGMAREVLDGAGRDAAR